MRDDAIALEDGRLEGYTLQTYPWRHERHRIFPQVFDRMAYGKLLDVAAGIGVIAQRIQAANKYELVCNEVNPQCREVLATTGARVVSFDLDDPSSPYPFPDASFDAVLSLATMEHLIHIEHHLEEIHRILKPGGHLYLSTPNYTGIHFLLPFVFTGRTFHDPMKRGIPRYEFFAHVRYFTYRTLVEFTSSFAFAPETVFLPLPQGSAQFQRLQRRSRLLAAAFRLTMRLFYLVFSPRWAFHPVLRFTRVESPVDRPSKPRRRII
jgi:SAM-dependent methyltransferase